jgi:hypothetical protein
MKENIGVIAGGVVGGIFALVLIVFMALWFIRRRGRAAIAPSTFEKGVVIDPSPPPGPIDSYGNTCVNRGMSLTSLVQGISQTHIDIPVGHLTVWRWIKN